MSILSIPKIYPCGSDAIITKFNTSSFSITAIFPATYLYDSNVITQVSSLS